MDICWVNFSLDNVEYGDVAALLARICRNHAILWLKETTHDVQNCRFTDCLGRLDVVACKWGIGGHEEMASRCRD